jgi:hypothetical protein
MDKRLLQLFCVLVISVGIIFFSQQKESPAQITYIEKTPIEQWQDHLIKEIHNAGLTERDYVILKDIVFCESSWGQYYGTGEVKVSNGNIGLAQINRLAHEVEYTKLGLDPFDPFQNLTYAVLLYQRNGVRDWENWSGHCWVPLLKAKNIII